MRSSVPRETTTSTQMVGGNYDLDGRLDYQRDVMMANVELLLSKPSSGFEFVWENDSKLITSTPDISKLTPIPEDFNLTKIAYDRGDLDDLLKDEACTEDTREQLNSLMETTREINTGYINETGLPMVLISVSGGSTNDEGDGFGGPYGLHHVYDAKSTTMAGATVIFLEPYYELSYETNIIGIEFTEEELEQFPKGYYIQREAQQLVLPNTVIPGHHLARWYGLGIDETDIVVEDGKSIITFDWENNLSKNIFNDVSFFTELRAAYTEGRTVTFNPNGGKLKDGDAPIREIDMKDEEDSKFFDIGEVVPVREGYAFVGWCTSSDCTDESLITDTTSDDWLPNYYWMEEKDYDVQVYAKWEKNVTELTNSDTNVSISLTDGVPEDATLSADTIAQESVLESRPELKEELPGLLSIYDISVRQNGETLEIKDNPMTVKIPLNDHLKGYKYYQAVYLGDPLERFDAVVEGDFLVFETDHLSQYAILGSNTPFETSEHEHVWAEDWTSDGTHHWKACTAEGCAEKDQYGVHQIANGVCTVCKAEVETSGVQTYAVKVNGITVTSANASDILGDADGDGATAYYDPAANTLTLDNAQLTSSGFGAVWAQEENFTLVLKGENQITGEGDFPHSAVYSHGAMTVKGNGSLTTSGTYFGLFGNNTITIEDGASVDLTVDFSSDEQDQPYAAVRAIGGLTVDGATLNAKNNATQDAGFGTPGINTDLTAINGAKVNISSVNDHGICGDVIVSGAGTVVNASSASGEHYGIFAGQEDIFGELGGDQKGIFTISDGAVVTASGGKGAMRWKPDLSGYTDPVVAAGDSAAAEEIIGDPAGTEYQNEKYVQVRSSLEPVEPTDPTDPTDPTTPTDPTDPTTPTDPTDPAGPTDPTTPTDPADPADPTDPAKPEQQGKPSEQIESPQTGDSSDMALWIGLMLASCGGVLGMLFYRRKKGGGREIRLRDKTKPAKAPAGGLRAKTTARPGAAGIFFKKGYPFYPLVCTKG